MPKYTFHVVCCERGALGMHGPRVLVSEGPTEAEALLALYDRWEHILVRAVTRQDEGGANA